MHRAMLPGQPNLVCLCTQPGSLSAAYVYSQALCLLYMYSKPALFTCMYTARQPCLLGLCTAGQPCLLYVHTASSLYLLYVCTAKHLVYCARVQPSTLSNVYVHSKQLCLLYVNSQAAMSTVSAMQPDVHSFSACLTLITAHVASTQPTCHPISLAYPHHLARPQ